MTWQNQWFNQMHNRHVFKMWTNRVPNAKHWQMATFTMTLQKDCIEVACLLNANIHNMCFHVDDVQQAVFAFPSTSKTLVPMDNKPCNCLTNATTDIGSILEQAKEKLILFEQSVKDQDTFALSKADINEFLHFFSEHFQLKDLELPESAPSKFEYVSHCVEYLRKTLQQSDHKETKECIAYTKWMAEQMNNVIVGMIYDKLQFFQAEEDRLTSLLVRRKKEPKAKLPCLDSQRSLSTSNGVSC
jgi:hypothetical protein